MRGKIIDCINNETTNISLSIGRKYMYEIVDKFIKETANENVTDKKELLEDTHRSINGFIGAINDKELLNNFRLHGDLMRFFDNEDLYNKLALKFSNCNYGVKDSDDYYLYLLKHIRSVLNELVEYRKIFKKNCKRKVNSGSTGRIHLFFKLTPKQPDAFNPVKDLKPEYKSILCNFSLKNYRKYINKNKTSAEGWTFQLCMFYLVVIDGLYRILEPCIIPDIERLTKYIIECFTILNPVIVGFSVISTYKLNKQSSISALSVLYELSQVTAKNKCLQLHKYPDVSDVQLVYASKTRTFSDDTDIEVFQNRPMPVSDRLILLHASGKGDIIRFKIDIVGQGTFEDITGMACKKAFFSLITDDTTLDAITYKVVKRILSYTGQYESVSDIADEVLPLLYKKYVNSLVTEDSKHQTKANKEFCKKNFIHNNLFKELKAETKLPLAKALINKFQLKKYEIDYLIIAFELSKYDSTDVSNILTCLGSKQQVKVRKMIEFIKTNEKNFKVNALNELYNAVSYWS